MTTLYTPEFLGSFDARPRQSSTAVYEGTVTDDGLRTMSPTTEVPFDAAEYSRFKYGNYPQAERYGSLISDALQRFFTLGMAVGNEPIVLLGTPYKSVPNAAKLLTGIATRKLRQEGYAVSAQRMYQPALASGDYGKLSYRERAIRNELKVRYFDVKDFVGKHVVLVDDISVTGSIAATVRDLFKDLNIRSFTMIHLLRLHFELSQVGNAQVENTLNHASVKQLNDLLPLMAVRDEFVLIARTVKRILEADEPELRAFLSELDKAQLVQLYHAAVDDGYDDMEPYQASFRVLEAFYPY